MKVKIACTVAIDPEISSSDTYEQVVSLQANPSNFLKLKEITLPEAELLNGVMNEISRGAPRPPTVKSGIHL